MSPTLNVLHTSQTEDADTDVDADDADADSDDNDDEGWKKAGSAGWTCGER